MSESSAESSRVLGVDPGSRRMGWAVITTETTGAPRRVASGVLEAPGQWDVARRLGFMLRGVQELLEQHKPHELAIEQAFVYKNPKTALVIGQARGIPMGLAAAAGMGVYEYQPSVIKRATVGSGRAAKEQMQRMVQLLFGMTELPQEDEADALAVALTHARTLTTTEGDRGTMTEAQAYYLAVTQRAKATAAGRRR